MFSCLGLSSCAFFCVFCFVYCRDFFLVEKFPVQRPDRRVVYCNGLFYVFPTRNIVNFLINFTFSTATYLSMARYSLFMLKVSLYPSQLNMQYTTVPGFGRLHTVCWAEIANYVICQVLNSPFCPLLLLYCWLGYILYSCQNCAQNDLNMFRMGH